MTAGRRRRARNVAIAIVIAAAVMHLFAWWIVKGYADANVAYDAATLVGVTGTLLLSWSLLLSQAMESVTRAFYARSDLDLILTSPVSARKVFAVRMGRIAAASVAVALLLAAPFIDVLALRGGAALACGLRRGGGDGCGGDRGCARAHHRAVSPGRRQAHPADRADRRGGDRRRLRHRPADRRHLLVRHAVALCRAAIAMDAGARARSGERLLVAGARRARRSRRARRRRGHRLCLARRGDRAVLAPLRRAHAGRGRRRQRGGAPAPRRACLPSAFAGARAAAQGMGAAQARSLADVADADAGSVSAAAGAVAVGHLPRRHRRLRGADPGDGDGGRPACRRSRLAHHLGRGRARSGGERAASRASACCAPRSRR